MKMTKIINWFMQTIDIYIDIYNMLYSVQVTADYAFMRVNLKGLFLFLM